jgi:MFS transporter, DHA3 family, tetracycline resistance protein
LFADRLRVSASRVYLLMGAWGGFAWALISAAYVLYYITVAHLDPLQLVLVGTALETSYFVCEIPTGVLADTFSRRLSVIAGTAIIGIAWMGQGLVPLFIAIVGFEICAGSERRSRMERSRRGSRARSATTVSTRFFSARHS